MFPTPQITSHFNPFANPPFSFPLPLPYMYLYPLSLYRSLATSGREHARIRKTFQSSKRSWSRNNVTHSRGTHLLITSSNDLPHPLLSPYHLLPIFHNRLVTTLSRKLSNCSHTHQTASVTQPSWVMPKRTLSTEAKYA